MKIFFYGVLKYSIYCEILIVTLKFAFFKLMYIFVKRYFKGDNYKQMFSQKNWNSGSEMAKQSLNFCA